MIQRLRSWSEFWWGIGFACLLALPMLYGFDAWKLASLDDAPIDRSSGFVATLRWEKRNYVLETAGGNRIECPRDFCSYPDVAADLGTRRTYYMNGGRLIGVERGDQLLDLRHGIRAALHRRLWWATAITALSLPCFWAALRARKQQSLEPMRSSA